VKAFFFFKMSYTEQAELTDLRALCAMGVYDYTHTMWSRVWPFTSPPLRLLEDPSRSNNDGGYILWPPALALAKYVEVVLGPLGRLEGRHVLVLGAGCGLVSLVCSHVSLCASVTACEHPAIFPWLSQNMSLNPTPEKGRKVQAVPWDWNDRPPLTIPSRPDVLLAADVTYNPKYHDVFLLTIVTLMQRNPYESVMYLFHDDASIPGNARHRTIFLTKARQAGLDVSKIDLENLVALRFSEESIHGYELKLMKPPKKEEEETVKAFS